MSVGEAAPVGFGARKPLPAAFRRSRPPEAEKIRENGYAVQARRHPSQAACLHPILRHHSWRTIGRPHRPAYDHRLVSFVGWSTGKDNDYARSGTTRQAGSYRIRPLLPWTKWVLPRHRGDDGPMGRGGCASDSAIGLCGAPAGFSPTLPDPERAAGHRPRDAPAGRTLERPGGRRARRNLRSRRGPSAHLAIPRLPRVSHLPS
jgi:hypothetical protein